MLDNLFKFLNKDILGKSWEKEETHPFFGDVVLFQFKDSKKDYWECEVECDGAPVSIGVDVPEDKRLTDKHVEFARQILSDLDATFELARTILCLEFETNYDRVFPEDWREVFRFVGFQIPIDGQRENDWELTFESVIDPHHHHFTCYFENGQPARVSVDG
jgi:hypothetical protein